MSLDQNAAPAAPPVAPPAAPPATLPAGVTPTATPPGNGTPPNGDLWFYKPELGLDKETQDYLAGKNPPTLADAIKSARHYEQLVRDRNAMTAPAVQDQLHRFASAADPMPRLHGKIHVP